MGLEVERSAVTSPAGFSEAFGSDGGGRAFGEPFEAF